MPEGGDQMLSCYVSTMSKRRVLTEAQATQITALHQSGKSRREVSEAVGIPEGSLLREYRRLGLPLWGTGRRRPFSDALYAQLAEEYRRGDSTNVVACRHGMSAGLVAFHLRRQGVEMRPTGCLRKGGRAKGQGGYVLVSVAKDHPLYAMGFTRRKGNYTYILEHRFVMAEHLGRLLRNDETVHHVDGNRKNNVITNLQLRQGKHGKGVVLQCRCCGSTDLVPVPIADVHKVD